MEVGAQRVRQNQNGGVVGAVEAVMGDDRHRRCLHADVASERPVDEHVDGRERGRHVEGGGELSMIEPSTDLGVGKKPVDELVHGRKLRSHARRYPLVRRVPDRAPGASAAAACSAAHPPERRRLAAIASSSTSRPVSASRRAATAAAV